MTPPSQRAVGFAKVLRRPVVALEVLVFPTRTQLGKRRPKLRRKKRDLIHVEEFIEIEED